MRQLIYPKLVYWTVPILSGWMLLATLSVTAQDPQFSQFYAAPLYLNPAFAGSTQQGRVGMNYRNQWPAIDANFTTISAYADFYIEDKNSGIGALLTRDNVGIEGCSRLVLHSNMPISFRSRKAYHSDLECRWALSIGPSISEA